LTTLVQHFSMHTSDLLKYAIMNLFGFTPWQNDFKYLQLSKYKNSSLTVITTKPLYVIQPKLARFLKLFWELYLNFSYQTKCNKWNMNKNWPYWDLFKDWGLLKKKQTLRHVEKMLYTFSIKLTLEIYLINIHYEVWNTGTYNQY
jgi:hypothetical protein